MSVLWGFLCQLVSWVPFQLRKLLLRQECVIYIYCTMNIKTSNFLTKFKYVVHVHICDIHFLLFAQGNKFARKSAFFILLSNKVNSL